MYSKESSTHRDAGPEVIKLEFILKLKIKHNDWLHVRKQPIIAVYFEFETVLKFYNLGPSPVFTVCQKVISVYFKVYFSKIKRDGILLSWTGLCGSSHNKHYG